MASMRAAINAKCKECIYDAKATGTWRKQVEDCTSYQCPLYELRPVSAYVADAPEIGQIGVETE